MLAAADWSLGWDALVAAGTLGLAAGTFTLAWSTRRLAEQTTEEVEQSRRQVEASLEQARAAQQQVAVAQEQTRIAQLTLAAQIRPVLIDVPLELKLEEQIFYPGRDEPITAHRGGVHVGTSPDGAMISVPLRNAGAGLAMIRGIGLRLGTELPPPPVAISPANIPPGEYGRISFLSRPGDAVHQVLAEIIQRPGTFSVEVGYSDLAGQQYTVSRFDVHFRSRAHYNWEVRQVHHSEPGGDAYAGSAPTS